MKDWALEHPFLSFLLAYILLEVILKLVSRFYRLIMVSIRGWPPAHLDADGDWKPEPKEEE